ncbi:hypothetical protein NLI96_g4101 [Meripilus lineatus]|uniref:Uncharacterized protein n=1 Tax=Meripilus lineatus TaxID=2056292 RepID=A0AAD5V5J0_9APHY|nr:hypothetical protein NLI96_g4101 [Physisporinus lineatus]
MFKDVIRLALQNMDCGGISDEALTTAANMIWESFTSDDKSRHMDPADHQEMEINAQTSGNSQDVSASGNNCGDLSVHVSTETPLDSSHPPSQFHQDTEVGAWEVAEMFEEFLRNLGIGDVDSMSD